MIRKGKGEMTGFIIPNDHKSRDVEKFAVSVREVEKATGLNFYSELPPSKERALESRFQYNSWR